MIKEIILVTIGAPNLIKTWSGVPYFLLNELQKKSIKVDVIDLEPNRYVKALYNIIIMPFVSLFIREGEKSIYRSVFFQIYQTLMLKVKIRRYRTADVIVGLSYNLLIPDQSRPIVLFSDWPFSYELSRSGVNPGWYHRYHIEWERKCLKNASQVISLFPTCAKYINNYLGDAKAISLGVNVVNNLMQEPEIGLIESKKNNKNVVFIGRKHYLKGAMTLIALYEDLKNLFPSLQIDVVGLTKDDFPENFLIGKEDVRFHGYLDKGDSGQCLTYYEILNNASLYVNTTPGWVGYTSMIEAMYYYTPVVVYPCTEFIDEFGEDIKFGAYCTHNENLVDVINKTLSDQHNFECMCINAHNRVSCYTWSNFVEEFLSSINKKY